MLFSNIPEIHAYGTQRQQQGQQQQGNQVIENYERQQQLDGDIENNKNNNNIEINEIPMDDEPIPDPLRRSTRTPKPRQFFKPSFEGKIYEETNHLVTQVHPKETLEYEAGEVHMLAEAFVQTYNLTRGIKKFGDKGRQAAIDEMRQLHDRAATCELPLLHIPMSLWGTLG